MGYSKLMMMAMAKKLQAFLIFLFLIQQLKFISLFYFISK